MDIATSVKTALALFQTRGYDAVIADYRLHGTSGLSLLEQVRGMGNTVPFIFFAGQSREEVIIEALNNDADYFLQKGNDPVSRFPELVHVVKAAIHRRRSEVRLHQSEHRFRSIMNQLPGMAWAVDTSLRYTLLQGAGLSRIGLRRDQVVGMTLYEVFRTDDEEHPVIRHHRSALMGGPVVFDQVIGDKTFRNYLSPLTDGRGRIAGVTGLAVEITEQVRALSDLRESEERFRSFVENASDVVYSLTMEGIFSYVSPNWTCLLGHHPEEVIGRSFTEFVHPDDVPHCTRFLERYRAGVERQPECEYRVLHKDGAFRWHSTNASMIRGLKGTQPVFLGIARDITETRHVKESLRSANRQLTLLGSITRHDINNKITVLLASLELLKDSVTEPEALGQVDLMEGTVRAIQSQIAFTTVYQDVGSHEPQWQKLDSVLPDGNLPPGITLEKSGTGVEIYADIMLKKVFSNLLDNSLRHGGRVTRLEVFAKPGTEGLVITWTDNGCGIPAGEKEKIFLRGYGNNTGLGMFLVREVLGLTGISIRESGEPGKGARFELLVPEEGYRFPG